MSEYHPLRALGIGLAASLLMSTSGLAQAIVVDGYEVADEALTAAAKEEGNRFVMYHGWPEQMFIPIQEAFEADTGITLETVRLTSQNMYSRVTSEHSAGRLEADYVDMTDLVLLKELVDLGIVDHPHRVPSYDDLAESFREADGRWYAGGLFTQVMAVNTAIVEEGAEPASWKDALTPEWKGNIGLPSIDAGGSAFTLYTYLRNQIDPEYWEQLSEQEPRIYPAVTPAAQDLVRGEFGLGLMGASTVVAQIDAGAPLKIIFPEEGIAAFPVSGGITSTASNPNSAAIWLNWITSPRAGDVLGPASVYAVHPDAATPALENGVVFPDVSQVWAIDPELWESVREEYSIGWRSVFGY